MTDLWNSSAGPKYFLLRGGFNVGRGMDMARLQMITKNKAHITEQAVAQISTPWACKREHFSRPWLPAQCQRRCPLRCLRKLLESDGMSSLAERALGWKAAAPAPSAGGEKRKAAQPSGAAKVSPDSSSSSRSSRSRNRSSNLNSSPSSSSSRRRPRGVGFAAKRGQLQQDGWLR